MTSWQQHVERWKDCTECGLCTQRSRIVLARGQVPCDVLFCGEAPGDSEDTIGKPFVGPAGQLLEDIVQRAMPDKIRRAYTNLVACFPAEAKEAGTNEPSHDEIRACEPRLVEFVRMCRPKLIVLVGKLAASYIIGVAQFRLDNEPEQPEWIPEGKTLEFVEIYHPAYILRLPLAQRGMAAKKCEITIRNALVDIGMIE